MIYMHTVVWHYAFGARNTDISQNGSKVTLANIYDKAFFITGCRSKVLKTAEKQ